MRRLKREVRAARRNERFQTDALLRLGFYYIHERSKDLTTQLLVVVVASSKYQPKNYCTIVFAQAVLFAKFKQET
jgi:hypothetical protein